MNVIKENYFGTITYQYLNKTKLQRSAKVQCRKYESTDFGETRFLQDCA